MINSAISAETMYAARALLAAQGSSFLEGRQTGLTYDCTSLSAVALRTPERRPRS